MVRRKDSGADRTPSPVAAHRSGSRLGTSFFPTDLRIGHERTIFPVYFDRFPASEAVADRGGVRIEPRIPFSTARSLRRVRPLGAALSSD